MGAWRGASAHSEPRFGPATATRLVHDDSLRLADYEVLAFASGEDFLAALADTRPDCALLDVHLPGLTGIEVQKRLQSDRVQLPVVFITASEDPAVERHAMGAGGLRVLRKPFTCGELLACVESALQSPPNPHCKGTDGPI